MIFIALIFALAAALWFAILIRSGGVFLGCLLVVAAGAVLGHPFFNVSVITLDRLLLGVICGLYFMQRFQAPDQARSIVPSDLVFGLFLLVLAASTVTHDFKFSGGQPLARLLFLNLMPAAVYWMVRQLRLRDDQIQLFFKCAAGFAVYLALTGIAEVANLHGLVFPRYIVSPEHVEFFGRARGPFLNPVANGLYMATGLACVWMFWPHCRTPLHRAILIAGNCLIGVGTLATLTRCVWLGVAGAVATIVWFVFPKQKRLGTMLLLISLAGLGIGLAGSKLNAFKRDKNVSVSDMSKSASLRPMLAAVAWQMFKEHPITGVGYGQYTRFNAHYIASRNVDMPLDQVRAYHQHNFVLALLTETGLVGLVPFLLLLAIWSRIGLQLWQDTSATLPQRQMGLVFLCFIVNYLASGAFHDVLLIPMFSTLLFLMAGMLTSVAQERKLVVPIASSARASALSKVQLSA